MHTENHTELLKGSSGGSLSSQLAELLELEIMYLQLGPTPSACIECTYIMADWSCDSMHANSLASQI